MVVIKHKYGARPQGLTSTSAGRGLPPGGEGRKLGGGRKVGEGGASPDVPSLDVVIVS